MTGALAVLFLLTITLSIARVAGVALRLSGLPQPVAQFQAISALTGTGFTTSEAEGTMHHPVRRRILTLLMFTGHLGIVSLASTVILTMASVENNAGIFLQIFAMLVSIAAILALACCKRLDVVMCDYIAWILLRLGWMETLPYGILYESPGKYRLCEHIVPKQAIPDQGILIVTHDGAPVAQADQPKLAPGDRVTAYAKPEAQAAWADHVLVSVDPLS